MAEGAGPEPVLYRLVSLLSFSSWGELHSQRAEQGSHRGCYCSKWGLGRKWPVCHPMLASLPQPSAALLRLQKTALLVRDTHKSAIPLLVEAASKQLPWSNLESLPAFLLGKHGSSYSCRALASSGTFQENTMSMQHVGQLFQMHFSSASLSPQWAQLYQNILFWDPWLTAVKNQHFNLAFSFCKRLYCVTAVLWSQRLWEQVQGVVFDSAVNRRHIHRHSS